MGKYRGIDDEPGWVQRKFRDLERQIKEMRSEKRIATSTVGTDGALTIEGELSVVGKLDLTGDLSMKSGDGAELVRMGDMTYGRGLAFARSDGVEAFVLARAFSNSDKQTWGLYDRNGAVIVSEEPLASGLARPRLQHPFQPYAATPGTAVTCGPYGFERSTAATVWETLFVHEGRKQNAFLDFKFAAMCSDATTAAEIRAVDLNTGTQLASFVGVPWAASVPAGSTTMTVVDPAPQAAVLPGAVDDYVRVGVQVRVTAGAGTVTLAVPLAMGG